MMIVCVREGLIFMGELVELMCLINVVKFLCDLESGLVVILEIFKMIVGDGLS